MTDELRALITLLVPAVAPAVLRAWDIGRAVDEALEACHVPRKVAAAHMGISESQLSRAIRGVGPEQLSADRLTRLPRPVWLHLLLAIGEQFGVADSADTRAFKAARRMARQVRAVLTHDNDKEAVVA